MVSDIVSDTVSNSHYWTNDPKELVREFAIIPSPDMSLEGKSNAAARLIIICTAIAFAAFPRPSILITGVACLMALALMTKHLSQEETQRKIKTQAKEGFQDMGKKELQTVGFTQPTTKNPLMNVLLPEIGTDPTRAPAAPSYNAVVETDINSKTQEAVMANFGNDKNIDKRLFKDLGDSLGFDRSMLTFNSTANTQIPNDQEGFAKFCYGDMKSGKDGSKAGLLESIKPRVIDGQQ